MIGLDFHEIEWLRKILEEYFTGRSIQYLDSLMVNCKIKDKLNLNYNVPTQEFVEVFLAQAGNSYSYNDTSKKVTLIIFLEYLKFKLADDEQVFITNLIAKYSHRIENSEYQSKRKDYNDLLAKSRQEQPQKPPRAEPTKIDKEIIVGYDLESLATEFTQRVGYEGIFAFGISGHDTILQDYIIERILRDLKHKTERPYRKIDVRLYETDIFTKGQVIESKLKICNRCQNIVDLFFPEISLDIVLVIWLYDISEKNREYLESVAIDFCEKSKIEVHPFVKNKSRCFIIIFAHVGFEHPINGLITLTIPKEFETTSLLQWFRGRLKQLELEDDVIVKYLLRLQNQHGHLIGTYQELQQIISDIQRGNLIM